MFGDYGAEGWMRYNLENEKNHQVRVGNELQ